MHVTDTYFVVAHFHYIMVGGMVMAYFGGLHYWWPKITGRLYPEFWARFAAILIFFGFNLTFFPQFILGYLGMPRRYHSLPAGVPGLATSSRRRARASSRSAMLCRCSISSGRWSAGAARRPNPWQATGLEWQTPSPPPAHNFEATPVVVEPPYHYAPRRAAMQAEHA